MCYSTNDNRSKCYDEIYFILIYLNTSLRLDFNTTHIVTQQFSLCTYNHHWRGQRDSSEGIIADVWGQSAERVPGAQSLVREGSSPLKLKRFDLSQDTNFANLLFC